MPRYIDADALLKKQTTIRVTYHCQGADEWDDYEVVLVKDINNAPTLSPDEVRGVGEWISERDGSIVELDEDGYVTDSCHCSVCNEHLDGSEEYAVKGNYCPNCGARMKGAEDGTTD